MAQMASEPEEVSYCKRLLLVGETLQAVFDFLEPRARNKRGAYHPGYLIITSDRLIIDYHLLRVSIPYHMIVQLEEMWWVSGAFLFFSAYERSVLQITLASGGRSPLKHKVQFYSAAFAKSAHDLILPHILH